jgi:hypothetical protein
MYKGKYSDDENEGENFEEEYIDDEYEESNTNVKKDFWEAPAQ